MTILDWPILLVACQHSPWLVLSPRLYAELDTFHYVCPYCREQIPVRRPGIDP